MAESFDTEWAHTRSLLAAKTVKDMLIQADRDTWTPLQIKAHFFNDHAVWYRLSQLTLNMQKYVMMSPAYAKHNPQEDYQAAFNGDREKQDFCMANFKTC